MIFKAKKIMKMEEYEKLRFENPRITNVRFYPHTVTTNRVEIKFDVEVD